MLLLLLAFTAQSCCCVDIDVSSFSDWSSERQILYIQLGIFPSERLEEYCRVNTSHLENIELQKGHTSSTLKPI